MSACVINVRECVFPLTRVASAVVEKRKNTKKTFLSESPISCSPYKKSQQWKDMTHAISVHLHQDMVVVRDSFKAMVGKLHLLYVTPSCEHFTQNTIQNLNISFCKKVKQIAYMHEHVHTESVKHNDILTSHHA